MKYFVYVLYNFTQNRNIKFELIFVEVFKNEKDARKRERYLKSSKGKFALRAMLKETVKN